MTHETKKDETMKTEQRTAGQVVQEQNIIILRAIQLMQQDLREMDSTISPETDNWGDVSKYAHVADIAHMIVRRHEEV